MSTVEKYSIRGIDICGFYDMDRFVEHLFADDGLATGTLVAINAEKVMIAEQDPVLRDLIDAAEYKYADGISIVRSIRKKYSDANIKRIAGADLWERLMQKAGEKGTPVFLVGGKTEVLAETCDKLKTQWQVNIVGSQDGYFKEEQREALYERICQSGAKLITVAMGSPRQEIFMRDCRQRCPDALYMGVGGTYDVFIGRVKRAPKVWQNMGLEWLYRLLSQPTRWRRQVKLMKYLFYHYSNRL